MMQSGVESVEKEVCGEIMATDVFVKIISDQHSQEEMTEDIENVFSILRDFESRFSRFIEGNELWQFNQSEISVVSDDLFAILLAAKKYFFATNGIFNPSILPILLKEGYVSKKSETIAKAESEVSDGKIFSFDVLQLHDKTHKTKKPQEMKVDLGGIGKGYIVDKVSRFLCEKYDHFIVDAGGDIFVSGVDLENDYDYWVIGIENPFDASEECGMVLLKDKAIATSGVNRRKWMRHGEEKHHLIDTFTQKSSLTDLECVTVISDTVMDADIWAKAFLLSGFERGKQWSEDLKKPALFVDKNGLVYFNAYYEEYAYKE